jgi:hypothetical protein
MVAIQAFEEVDEAVLGEQFHVLGEHRKKRAHEEGGDGFGAVTGAFQRLGEEAQTLGNFARDAGAAAGRIEGFRISPGKGEVFPDFGIIEPVE